MSATFESLLARVQALLMDDAGRVFGATALAEGLRLALGELNLARAAEGLPAQALAGLDGAPETTLSDGYATPLVLGAAGYTAAARAVDRAESFEMAHEAGDLSAWAALRLGEFRAMLAVLHPTYAPGASAAAQARSEESARRADLRIANNTPWGTWEEEE